MNYNEFFQYDFEKIPRGGKINARRLELENRIGTNVFVFTEEPLLFQCIFATNEIASKLPIISGVRIKYEQYAEAGNKMQNYILLECSDSAYLKQFTALIKDIITEYDNSDLSMSTCVSMVIEKWKHFFAEPRK